jgi:hypothetical protein
VSFKVRVLACLWTVGPRSGVLLISGVRIWAATGQLRVLEIWIVVVGDCGLRGLNACSIYPFRSRLFNGKVDIVDNRCLPWCRSEYMR